MFDKPSICLKNETSNFSISFKEWLFPQASHQVNITGYITELKMFENVFFVFRNFCSAPSYHLHCVTVRLWVSHFWKKSPKLFRVTFVP